MVDYHNILRLHSLGTSQRNIAREVQNSRDTVAVIIKAISAAGITWSLEIDVTNEDSKEILFPGRYVYSSNGFLHRAFCLFYRGCKFQTGGRLSENPAAHSKNTRKGVK